MKKYRLKEDFGGMKAGDVIETNGEIGEVFPAGSFEVIEDVALEVATPDGNYGDGEDDESYDDESDDDENDAHIDNQRDGIIPSYYNPVAAQVQVEQQKPKRGRPAKQD